jgi:hypothetical protein
MPESVPISGVGVSQSIDWSAYRETIRVPTAHIWGAYDAAVAVQSAATLSNLCQMDLRSIFIHQGAHEIPGFGDASGLVGAVRCIQRTIDRIT